MTTRGVRGTRTATPAHGRLRVLRGAVLAVATVLVPAIAHMTAGGAVPVDLVFLLAATVLGGACVAFADRRRNLTDIGGVVLLSQPIMHAVLACGGHNEVTSGGFGMVVAHIFAGTAVSCLLAGAESVIWAWWSLCHTALWTGAMWARFARAMTSSTLGIPGAIIGRRDEPLLEPSAVVLTSAPRRGPPHLRMA